MKREAEKDWGKMAMVTRTHFACRIDLWTDYGKNIVEYLAEQIGSQNCDPIWPSVAERNRGACTGLFPQRREP
jgi:hypothetical protein